MVVTEHKDKLPEGWRWTNIENVCKEKPRSGGTPLRSNPNYFGGDIPWAITEDLTNAGMYISETQNKITKSGFENSNARCFPKGTILLAMYGSIGRMSITKIELTTNQAILGLIPDETLVLTKYLYYFLDFAKYILIRKGRGGTQANINAKMVKSFPIITPPLPEQQKIVDKLDKQMAQIEMMKEEAGTIANQFDTYTQSFIDNLCENVECRDCLFDELVDEFRYGTSNKADPYEKGLPVLRIPNIIGEGIELEDLKYVKLEEQEKDKLLLKKGDLLFVRSNGNPRYIGRCATFNLDEDKYVFASYLIRARIKKELVYPEFLNLQFRGDDVRRQLLSKATTTAGNYNINTQSLKSIKLRIPSLDKQSERIQKFCLFEEVASETKTFVENQLKAINELPSSILNEVFGQYEIPGEA